MSRLLDCNQVSTWLQSFRNDWNLAEARFLGASA
jgi:hypothetical protein